VRLLAAEGTHFSAAERCRKTIALGAVAAVMNEIAVTGATGNIGGRVVRHLEAAGVRQRLLVRDPSRAPQLENADVVTATYADADAVRRALTGIDTVLMVSASETLNRVAGHRTFVDAAAGAGVTHVVYTSFFGARPDATFTLARDHWATEEHIKASGMQYTFLRDNLYADFLGSMFGEDGVLRGPAGDGVVAAVAQADIAEVAAAVLHDPVSHADATYDLTGPEALSLDEIAAIVTAATGRPMSYRNETLDEAYASRASYGAPDWQVDAWVSTYTAIANGELAGVTDSIESITGHRATSLAELLAK
jgi:uncharacterized protein YbjT (DUF2867 family)